MNEPRAALRRHWLPLAALLALALAPFVPSLVRGACVFFLDMEDHWYPLRLAAYEARSAGAWPHWFRYAFCGAPLHAQLETAAAYPPHLLLDLFPPKWTLLPTLVGHRWLLGGLLYFALVRRDVSRRAAFLGAAAWMHCGLVTYCVSQPAVLRTLAWVPLLLVAAHDLGRGRRLAGALWLALGAGLMLLAGYPPFLERVGWIVPILLLLDVGGSWRDRGLAFVAAGLGLVLAVGLAAVQLVPSMELAAISQRQLGLEPAFADTLRAAPADLLLLVVPRFSVDNGVAKQGFAYLGAVPIALAVLALVRRVPGARAFGVAAAFSLVAALGAQTPVGAVLQRLPGISGFKNPTQYLVIWSVAVPVLAAFGLDAWLTRRPSGRELAIAVGVPAAWLVAGALVPSFPDDRATQLQLVLVAGTLVSVIVAWRVRDDRWAAGLLVAVAVLDAGSLGVRYLDRPGRSRPFAEVGRPDPSLARIAAYHAEHGDGQPARVITSNARLNWDNHAAMAGLENVRGLLSLVPLTTLDLSRIVAEGAPFERKPATEPLYDYGPVRALDSPLVDLLALRYAAGYADSPGPDWRRIGPEDWTRDAADPARLVRHAVAVPGDTAWETLVRPGFDARSMAVIDSTRSLADRDDDPGRVTSFRNVANGAEMSVEAAREAVLVWSESRDAGWSATIDGVPASILTANYAHMAVVVPPGEHKVSWRYESPGWWTGLYVTFGSLAAFAALIAWSRRRR